MTADLNLADGKEPRFIKLSLHQIQVPLGTFRWTHDAGFYPMATPAISKQALPMLQFIQPILVVPADNNIASDNKNNRYTLLAGRRTFQLICEHLSRKSRIWVIRVGHGHFDPDSCEVLDILSTILLRRPDDGAKAMIAAALHKDEVFSAITRNFVDISTTHKIAGLLGMSRATFNRVTKSVQGIATSNKSEYESVEKTTLGLSEDDELVDE